MQLNQTRKLRRRRTAIDHKFVLVALALMCKLFLIAQLRKHMQARDPSTSDVFAANSPVVWPSDSVAPPIRLAFENSVRYGLHTPDGDAEWSSLAPNDGLIYLGDDHRVFSISMYHELRCLNVIRKGIVQAIDGNATVSDQLVQHCLNYVRQMIFCRSNTMLTGFVQGSDAQKPRSFINIQQCNDWTEIYRELERNQAEHQKWMAGDEAP